MLDPITLARALSGTSGRKRINALWHIESALVETVTDSPNLSADDTVALMHAVTYLRSERKHETLATYDTGKV